MYRTAPAQRFPDAIVLCRKCAAPADVARDAESFRCGRCATEQLTQRAADDLVLEEIRVVDTRPSEVYPELEPFLADSGAKGRAIEAVVACDGLPITIAISLNSGTVNGLDITAPTSGVPDLRLVREDAGHKDAKERGVAVEVQTGDPEFDDAVYVESRMRDDDVRLVLAAPAVRAAARKLLATSVQIRVEDGTLHLYVAQENNAFEPAAIGVRLGLVRVIAGAMRPRRFEEAEVRLATRVATTLSWVQLVVALPFAITSCVLFAPSGAGPYFLSALLGLVPWVALGPLVRRALAGRSTSHRDVVFSRATTFVGLPLLCVGLLFTANAVLDRSPERTVDMKVVEVAPDSDDSSLVHATCAEPNGETHRYSFHANIPPTGARVTTRWRAGALGWRWESGDAVLKTGPDIR